MWYLLDTVQASYVVKSVDRWRKTTVEAEYLIVYQGSEGQVIEQVGKIFPDIGVPVFAKAFIIKAVDLGNLTGLVIAAEDSDSLRISDLESNKQGDSLDRVVATIDIVACPSSVTVASNKASRLTHEEVIGIWIGTTDTEQLHQVVELAMDVATYRDWAFLHDSVSV